jgi:hypothetical protein
LAGGEAPSVQRHDAFPDLRKSGMSGRGIRQMLGVKADALRLPRQPARREVDQGFFWVIQAKERLGKSHGTIALGAS